MQIYLRLGDCDGFYKAIADIDIFEENGDNAHEILILLRREEPCHVKDIFRKEMY